MSDENSDVYIQEFATEAGDTIETIALAFNITPEALQAENPNHDLSNLSPEQIIQIPFPRPCRGTIYVVRRGDTLSSIARQFGVSEEAILRENPFLRILGVRPGFQICIPQPQPITCPGGTIYTVAVGDTLFSIAARFNTTVGAIIQANPGINPNRLFVGQRICIPAPQPPACPGGFFYTVVFGDTLFTIALRFNTTVDAILRANPGLNPNQLFAGQRICIPGRPSPICQGTLYTVVAGDTLVSIAVRFNTTVQAIIQANPGLNPNFIVPGQQICIPTQPTPCTGFIYTVVAGDTLFAIAARFNTTVQAIIQANPGLNPNFIVPGQQICIPTQPTPCTGFIYTVVAGDTLFAIAARFNTTVDAILRANPGLNPNMLFVGQLICIPR